MGASVDRNARSELSCGAHGTGKPWVVCSHVTASPEKKRPAHLRRIESIGVSGEVLCDECLELVDAGRAGDAPLRLACERCVLDRFGAGGT